MSGLEAVSANTMLMLSPGETRTHQVACPAGKHAVGGGFDTAASPGVPSGLGILRDGPAARDGSGRPTAWAVTVLNDAAPTAGPGRLMLDLEVTAMCVTLP